MRERERIWMRVREKEEVIDGLITLAIAIECKLKRSFLSIIPHTHASRHTRDTLRHACGVTLKRSHVIPAHVTHHTIQLTHHITPYS